jgi:predicted glycoside hydrolase/deacetylase ChbG (UPF0249 family)
MTRLLIVTADDVGLHRGMTDGAILAHREGVVTACSVVANGAALEHALEQLREVPGLSAGIHLTLVEERPLASGVGSLVGSSGLLHENYLALVPRYLARMLDLDEVTRELRAQIERLLGAGLRLEHANGHQHLHLLPRVFEIVLRLCEEYSIPYVRIVDEKAHSRRFSMSALSALGRRARRAATIRTNDRTIGVAEAGQAADFIALLDRVDGLTELVTHPGIGDSSLREAYDWGYAWDAETTALCDPRLREAIAARGILLVSPRQLT